MFRGQALAALTRPDHGSVHIGRPWRDSVAAGVAVALAIAFALFCALGTLTRKASVAGVLAHPAGTVSIRARDAGQVAEVRAAEGEHVKAGTALVVIRTEHIALAQDGRLVATAEGSSASIRARAAQLEFEKQARIRFYEARVHASQARAASLALQLRHAQTEVEALRRRGDLASASSQRLQSLAEGGWVPATQAQATEEAALDAASRLEAARRAALALASELASAASETRSLREQMAGEVAALERSIASTQEDALLNATRRQVVFTAPGDGIVSTLQLAPGQAVQPGEQLLDFLPDAGDGNAHAQVQLFAPGRMAGFIRPGDVVNVRFDAFPFQKFGMFKGRVAALSRTPYGAAEIPASVAPREPMYRVVVDMDASLLAPGGNGLAFKPGMAVAADVLLETRAIWEWALEPLIAVRRKS